MDIGAQINHHIRFSLLKVFISVLRLMEQVWNQNISLPTQVFFFFPFERPLHNEVTEQYPGILALVHK